MSEMEPAHGAAGDQVTKKQKTSAEGSSTPKPTIEWKKTPSFPPTEGSCTVWLPRKQRYCSHHATFGSTKCTTHAALDTRSSAVVAEATGAGVDGEELPPPAAETVATSSSRKTNLDRHLKRMLNPFSIPPLKAAPVWSELFTDPSLPLCIDIGCSKGLYIRDYRDKKQVVTSNWNFVGVEIFEPYVVAANAATAASTSLEPKNLAYVHANINNSLETLVAGQVLGRVSLLFPDPWGCGLATEHKNKKRRVMSLSFAKRLAAAMPIDSEFYLASDYEDLALDIRSHLLATGAFDVPEEGQYKPTMTAPAMRQSYENKEKKERLLDASKGVGKIAAESGACVLSYWLLIVCDNVMACDHAAGGAHGARYHLRKPMATGVSPRTDS
ncbi:hypothetical protein AaE_009484 [Aphanomyces astaci]|uniref:tRNA (guanine(46)-N(7))-methyltransferase n=2 Tax=Aphanomyces astaci TaxID=112090 RepID=A0A6A5AAB7_APHAT|nr:hypothetical protein AaE_009484 [Aphanomyces astaci]